MNAYADLIKLAIFAIFLFAIFLFGRQVLVWKEQAEQGALDRNKLEAVIGVGKDSDNARTNVTTAEVVVRVAQDNYQRQVQELEQTDEAVRDRNSRPVPDSLRDLARERRLARERSSGARVSSERDAAPPATE